MTPIDFNGPEMELVDEIPKIWVGASLKLE